MHINVKELRAAINTVKSLAKTGETVDLTVDNQVTYFYLLKGGVEKPTSTNYFAHSSSGAWKIKFTYSCSGCLQKI